MNNTDYSQYRRGSGYPESVRLEVCREWISVMATRAMTKQKFCQQHQVSRQSLSVWLRMYPNECSKVPMGQFKTKETWLRSRYGVHLPHSDPQTVTKLVPLCPLTSVVVLLGDLDTGGALRPRLAVYDIRSLQHRSEHPFD